MQQTTFKKNKPSRNSNGASASKGNNGGGFKKRFTASPRAKKTSKTR